jgi:hypothetical protein
MEGRNDSVYDVVMYGYAGGLIQTPELALKIAEVLVNDYYDDVEWGAVQPLDIRLEGDVWHISTRKGLRKPRQLIMQIAKRDGRIIEFKMPATIEAAGATHVRLSGKWKKEQQNR